VRFLQEKHREVFNVSGKDIKQITQTYVSWIPETSFALDYRYRREMGISRGMQKQL